MGNCSSQNPEDMTKTVMNNTMKKTFNGTFKDTLKNMKLNKDECLVDEIPEIAGDVKLDFVKTLKFTQFDLGANTGSTQTNQIDELDTKHEDKPASAINQLPSFGASDTTMGLLGGSTMKLTTFKKDDNSSTCNMQCDSTKDACSFSFVPEEGVVQIFFKLKE